MGVVSSPNRGDGRVSVAGGGDITVTDLPISLGARTRSRRSMRASCRVWGPPALSVRRRGRRWLQDHRPAPDDSQAQALPPPVTSTDGFDDILIGAENNSAGAIPAGLSHFREGTPFGRSISPIAGGSGGFRIVLNLARLSRRGRARGRGRQWSGFDDLIVGAPDHDIGGNNSGAGYVILGAHGASLLLDDVPQGSAVLASSGKEVATASPLLRLGRGRSWFAVPVAPTSTDGLSDSFWVPP